MESSFSLKKAFWVRFREDCRQMKNPDIASSVPLSRLRYEEANCYNVFWIYTIIVKAFAFVD